MSLAATWTVLVIVAALTAMVLDLAGPDTALLSALLALMVAQVLPVSDALAGFSNPGMLTVAALYIVAAGLQRTGAVARFALVLLGRAGTVRSALGRLVPAATLGSAIVNNTAVVAAMLPSLQDWARRRGIPASKLLLPLSYASILGGTCTLVGTSTNLIIAGLIEAQVEEVPGLTVPTMFSITPLGGTAAILGAALMVLAGPKLFPTRGADLDEVTVRTPLSATLVVEGSLDGCSLVEAGLFHNTGFFLAAIHRGPTVIQDLAPDTRILAGDRLVVVGDVACIADLRRTPGLTARRLPPSEDDDERMLVQVVVARRSSLVGHTMADVSFIDVYHAVVLALTHDRNIAHLRLSAHVFQPGDLLLLEATPEFLQERRPRQDFAIISPLDRGPPRRSRARHAVAWLAGFVLALGLGVPAVVAASVTAGGMIASRCITVWEARRALDLRVLVAISAAIGLGAALHATHLDRVLAHGILAAGIREPRVALLVVYVVTAVTTEMVTNNAAAVLALPVAIALAEELGVSPMPFVYAITMAASASFLSPIGYQTNLMVYGPGEYHATDYLKSGALLTLLVCGVTVALAPVLWPF